MKIEQYDNLPRLLRHVLSEPSGQQGVERRQARSFARYVRECALAWRGWRVRRGRHATAHALAISLPGNVILLMLAEPHGPQATDDQIALTATVAEILLEQHPYYLQALAEPDAVGRAAALSAAGFRKLTTLQYLQRPAQPVAGVYVDASEHLPAIEWQCYSDSVHDMFMHTVEQTNLDSLDCPELTALRPADAVLASHRAAGRFDPRCWELALIGGRPAGCVLSAGVVGTDLAEIVYVGVVPQWRRRGLGSVLLERSLHHAELFGAVGQIIVYDVRNHAARQLYERVGFVPLTRSVAWIRASSSQF